MNRSRPDRAHARPKMMTWMIGLLLGAVGFWLFFRWFEQANVFHPSRTFRASASDLGRPWEEATFTTADGTTIHGWFFPAPAQAPFADTAVLISHGNAGNIGDRLDLYQVFLGLGVNVLAYDYRGYGRSEGRPSEAGTALDAEAAADWLVRRGFPEARIVAHGESLGGAVAAELARRRPGLRGLILQSTFTSMPDIGAEVFPFLPVRLLGRIRYDTRSKLPSLRMPVLILHSRADTLIGFHHAEANHAAAREPRQLREILGGHNDQPAASPELFATAVREFLTATRPTAPNP